MAFFVFAAKYFKFFQKKSLKFINICNIAYILPYVHVMFTLNSDTGIDNIAQRCYNVNIDTKLSKLTIDRT